MLQGLWFALRITMTSTTRGTKRVAGHTMDSAFAKYIVSEGSKEQILIMDGGTGSEIGKRALDALDEDSWSGVAQLKIPEIVEAIHAEYVKCGARIVTTNTYASNRHCLAVLGNRTAEANQIACSIAKNAVSGVEGNVFVFGSISTHPPTFKEAVKEASLQFEEHNIESVNATELGGWPSEADELQNFREQAFELKRGGVDALALEMVKDVYHGSMVVTAAGETGLPVVLGLTVKLDDKGEVWLRDAPIKLSVALQQFLALCPTIVAVNIMHSPANYCSAGLKAVRSVWGGAMGVYPNNGTPDSWPDWTEGDLSPQELVDYAKTWANQGATLIGGCCGIGPAHISALSDYFGSNDSIFDASAKI